jgi:predicted branched-subunit amino acid permease
VARVTSERLPLSHGRAGRIREGRAGTIAVVSVLIAPEREVAHQDAWADVRAGAALMLPMVLAYIPFALVIGVVLADHGGVLVGLVGTWTIFGGSAHLATVRAADRAGVAVAVLTGLLINARLLVYSAGLARHWRDQPRWFRFAAAPFVIDPTWAVGERLAAECPDPAAQRRRFLAAGITLGVGFSATVAVGMLVGARISTADLAIAVPLCLLALVGPSLRQPANRRVVIVAAAVGLVTANWPAGTGLLLATVLGCAAGRPPKGGSP